MSLEKCKIKGDGSCRCVGVEICRTKDEVIISQQRYHELLEKELMFNSIKDLFKKGAD